MIAGQPAARLADPCAAGGLVLGPGALNVLIGG
jgi:uncharacterized Zn-binding protein involved in type VI secretion